MTVASNLSQVMRSEQEDKAAALSRYEAEFQRQTEQRAREQQPSSSWQQDPRRSRSRDRGFDRSYNRRSRERSRERSRGRSRERSQDRSRNRDDRYR